MAEFKDMLKYYRKKYGYSQAELAEKLGVSASAISMYEIGQREPNFEIEEKIADFFNVNLNTLRGKDTELPSPTLSDSEQFVVDSMRGFNAEGQQKVVDYVTDLNESGRYKKFSSSEIA